MLHMMIPWVTFCNWKFVPFDDLHLLHTPPQPTFCKHQAVPWNEDRGALLFILFIYFFKMAHVSERTLFLCTCKTSAGLSRSWICYSLNILCGILGCCVRMIIQWMVNSVRWECDLLPPVSGQILPALVCGSGALLLHISKVCDHSVMTLFPTIMIMDITFDKRFIN